jgi:hypothetical protein
MNIEELISITETIFFNITVNKNGLQDRTPLENIEG